MSIVLWAAVVLIGGAGSVLRFLADGAVSARVDQHSAGRDFPLGTLAVNVSGAVILGLLTGLALGHDEALLAGTAAVGSYTTFSTWMLETQRLTEERQHGKAAVNVVLSLAAGVAAAAARPPDRGSPVTEYQKLTSYFGERKRSGGAFVADALLELYGRHEIAASILLRGTEGFGLKHHLRTDRSLSLSEDLPLVAVAVDTRPRIEELLGPALALNRTGLVTVEGARLLDDTAVPGPDEETKLTVYLGRQERAYRVPAFVAVCDLLHRRGIDGATALLGVDGTAHGRRQRAAFFSRNAEVPMMIIAVGAGEQISRVLPELGALLRRPLLTLERVRVCKRDGQSMPGPGGTGPGGDRHGPLAEAHGLHVRGGQAPGPAGAPRHRPAAALGRAQRRHHAARHLGLPRRPRPARRPAAAAGPARARRDDRRRHPRAHRPGVLRHRRAHPRARAGDLRDHQLPRRGRP